ncbi:hypothetical protein HY009_07265, partial [Candidatus Acetothermia bacterium]|nr:hypothetical protein [Candidatus Acetothermia bacterium]
GLLEKKPIEAVSDEMLILADSATKAIQEVKGFIDWFLETNEAMTPEERGKVTEFLVGGYVAHSRPLSFDTLVGLKLPVKQGVPALVFELFNTCEFGSCKRPQTASFLW